MAFESLQAEKSICVLNCSRIYKLQVSIHTKENDIERIVTAVLDSGSSLDVVRFDHLPDDAEISPIKEPPRVETAEGKSLALFGSTRLTVSLGDMVVKRSFLVVEDLIQPMILGVPFLDDFVRTIDVKNKEVELLLGTKIPIVEKDLRAMMYLTHDLVIPPYAEIEAEVNCNRKGISLISMFERRRNFCASNGIELLRGEKTLIRLANFRAEPQTLKKGTAVAVAGPVQSVAGIMVNSDEEAPSSFLNDVDLSHLNSVTPQILGEHTGLSA